MEAVVLTIVLLTLTPVLYGYAEGFRTDRIVGLGFLGLLAGIALFGAQTAIAGAPRVPCWTEAQGAAQMFRAMPYICQAAAPSIPRSISLAPTVTITSGGPE